MAVDTPHRIINIIGGRSAGRMCCPNGSRGLDAIALMYIFEFVVVLCCDVLSSLRCCTLWVIPQGDVV
jgi:hypothetical protein